VRERRDGELEGDVAAQADGERRRLGVPVVGVGHDDDVGGELPAVLGEERRERAGAELLLPLQEHGDPEIEVAPGRLDQRAKGRHVRHHPGLVIRGAPGEQPVAAHGGLEGR
jgi:hypothetical protein